MYPGSSIRHHPERDAFCASRSVWLNILFQLGRDHPPASGNPRDRDSGIRKDFSKIGTHHFSQNKDSCSSLDFSWFNSSQGLIFYKEPIHSPKTHRTPFFGTHHFSWKKRKKENRLLVFLLALSWFKGLPFLSDPRSQRGWRTGACAASTVAATLATSASRSTRRSRTWSHVPWVEPNWWL